MTYSRDTRQENRVSGATRYYPGPIELPDRQIGIAVKAQQNAGRSAWISDYESDQPLSIDCLVSDLSCFGRGLEYPRGLKSIRSCDHQSSSSEPKSNARTTRAASTYERGGKMGVVASGGSSVFAWRAIYDNANSD